MRRSIFGGAFYWIFLALSTSYGTFFMLVPLLSILYISPVWFRKLADVCITFYLTFVVAMMEIVYGIKVVVSGDTMESIAGSNNLIIMNHRTRLDWMFFWCCLYRQSVLNLHNLKISLKYPIKHFPGLGWATQFAAYIFMRRVLDSDKVILSQMLDYYKKVRKDINLLFFVEGTDKCPNATRRSHAFAAKNNLPEYEYVLHPRVTGFSYVMQLMNDQSGDLDSLYDVTVAYRGHQGHIAQDELAILKGNFPREVHFYIKKYTKDKLPLGEEAQQEYCKELWKAKEVQLRDFYTKESKEVSSHGEARSEECILLCKIWQILALVYWFPFTFLCLYLTVTNTYVLSYVCICTAGMIICGVQFGGLDMVQARM